MRKKRKIKINTYPSLASRLWHLVRFHQEQKPDLTVSNGLEKMEEITSYAKISCRKLASRTRRRCTKCRNRFCSSHSRMRQGPPPFAPCVPQRFTSFIFVASKWRFRYLTKWYCFFFDRILRWSHLFSTIRSTLATLTSTAYLFRYEFYGVSFRTISVSYEYFFSKKNSNEVNMSHVPRQPIERRN